MNGEQIKQSSKKKFKGVENFLRRVAFNLGNTPSQTEVKIISCIPIDVTDLQQKIISLEKQLEQTTKIKASSSKPTSAVHTALYCQGFPNYSNVAVSCKYSDVKLSENNYENRSTKQRKSNVSFLFPTATPGVREICTYLTENDNCYSTEESQKCNSVERRRNIFRKDRKKKTPKNKEKTQLVYYTQTTTSPFNNYNKINIAPERKKKNVTVIDQKYLTDMIRKQYKPEVIIDKSSNCSQFSSPVCRDVNQTCLRPCPFESDVCSCCHSRFQNIDHHILRRSESKFNNILNPVDTYSMNECYDNSIYYDSSFYDVIPVKEKANKQDVDKYNREYKKLVDMMFRPEYSNFKSQYRPMVVNLQTKLPIRSDYVRKISGKLPKRKGNKCKKTFTRKRILNEMKQNVGTENSKSCCIDCGDVYTKRLFGKMRPQILKEPIETVLVKNVECLTNNVNDTECQTIATDIQIPSEENKAEMTLNQIKSILKSVLAEVKANAQTKFIAEEKSKRDAVVQKEPSQHNMQTYSTLLSSFTYSPYNTNSYIPSGSRQMNSNYCYPSLPFPTTKYTQNYPLFIHTPGRHTCTSCYRHNTRNTKPTQDKQARTTVNKIEAENNRNKETEKLIKEIYKSMALNVSTPPNDTSTSECDDLNSVANYSAVKSVYKSEMAQTKNNAIKTNIGKINNSTANPKKNKNDTREIATNITVTTDNTDTKFRNKMKIDAGTISSPQSSNTKEWDHRSNNVENKTKKRIEDEVERARRITEASSSKKYSDDEYETDDSDTESDNATMPTHEPIVTIKKKKGIFSKMAKLFKSKNKKRIEKSVETESDIGGESEASDSDDYQTVYSQKFDKIPHRYTTTRAHQSSPRTNAHKMRPHSKISYSKQRGRIDERPRMSPYMEQEYRRYWNEKLMFHRDQSNRYSSKHNFSWDSTPRTGPAPVYWQNYEARSALVDNCGQVPVNNSTNEKAAPNYNTFNKKLDPKVIKIRPKKLAWLKKHKIGVRCGEQWKKLILEG